MAKVNGIIWKIIPWLTGLIFLALSAYAGYISLGRDVGDNAKGVAANTERIDKTNDNLKEYVWPAIDASRKHIITDELNQTYMDKRFDKLEQDLGKFTAEQRSVNIQILRKLDE